jgi:UDP-glucose 4-epimerase
MADPGLYFNNNVLGGYNLAEAMAAAGVGKIVFSSTCATYGEPEKIPMTEDLPQVPSNPYGESKLMLEKILGWYAKLCGLRPVFLRYFNACGATERLGEDHYPETHLIPNVLEAAAGASKEVKIYGNDYDTRDGTCIRDYIHVSDLATAHLKALEKDVTGAFNLGTGTGYSVREVVNMVRDVTGRDFAVADEPRRAGDPAVLVAGNEKARDKLGWDLQFSSLRNIIESAWAWRQKNPRGYT